MVLALRAFLLSVLTLVELLTDSLILIMRGESAKAGGLTDSSRIIFRFRHQIVRPSGRMMISIVQRSPMIAVDRATGHKVSPISPHFDIVSNSLFFSYPLDDMIFIVVALSRRRKGAHSQGGSDVGFSL